MHVEEGVWGVVGGILKLPPTLERDKKVLGMKALRWSDKCSIYEKKKVDLWRWLQVSDTPWQKLETAYTKVYVYVQ